MKVLIKSESKRIPKYQTKGAAGFDLEAYLPEGSLIIKKGEIVLVPTGLFIEIPEGFEAQIRARSGISMKYGITLVNGTGTIDCDYRGEWKVPLINLGKEDFELKDGDRIAQAIISRYEKVSFELIDRLSETKRGLKGFGATGINEESAK